MLPLSDDSVDDEDQSDIQDNVCRLEWDGRHFSQRVYRSVLSQSRMESIEELQYLWWT